MNNIKWLLFDFGGCLDSDGVHSRTLFFSQFKRFGLINAEDGSNAFQEAYTYSDRLITNRSLMLDSSLAQMNEKMCTIIARRLNIYPSDNIARVAAAITDYQSTYLCRNRKILESFGRSYQLGIVSNFNGNLETILKEFSLRNAFNFVIDSYHVGCSKPDQTIFKLALSKCATQAEHVCFIGDNNERDIIPAKKAGMKTILISSDLQESTADFTLGSLVELLLLTQSPYPTAIQKISTNR